MRASDKKKTQCKKNLFFTVRFARQKLSKCYAAVTTTTGILLDSSHTFNAFCTLRSFQKWDMGIDIHPEVPTPYTTQYHELFLR